MSKTLGIAHASSGITAYIDRMIRFKRTACVEYDAGNLIVLNQALLVGVSSARRNKSFIVSCRQEPIKALDVPRDKQTLTSLVLTTDPLLGISVSVYFSSGASKILQPLPCYPSRNEGHGNPRTGNSLPLKHLLDGSGLALTDNSWAPADPLSRRK